MPNKSPSAHKDELARVRARLDEIEQTLGAIRAGRIDALVVATPDGDRVFTLQGAEHPYRVFIESVQEGAATVAADRTLLYCNARLAEMLQMPPERVIGASLASFVPPSDHALLDALFEPGPGSRKLEAHLRAAGGEVLPVQFSVSTIAEEDGTAWCLIATDLTEARRNQEIVTAEKLTRAILEQAAEAIVVCDPEGRIVRANRAAQRLCGRNPILQPFDAMFPLAQGDEVSGTILSGERLRAAQSRICREDGESFDVVISAGPLMDADGDSLGTVVTLTDITEAKQAQRQLAAQLAATQVLSRASTTAEAAEGVLRGICQQMQWPVGEFWAWDAATARLRLAQGFAGTDACQSILTGSRELSFSPSEGAVGLAWERGLMAQSFDAADPQLPCSHMALSAGLCGFVACPIRVADDLSGVLLFLTSEVHRSAPELANFFRSLEVQLAQWRERVRAEKELRAAHEELERRVFERTLELTHAVMRLKESAEFTRQIITNAGEGIFVLDRDFRYVVWNPRVAEMAGMAEEEVAGKRITELFPWVRETGVEALLQRALAGETVTSPDIEYKVEQTGRSGWARGSYSPQRNARGEIVGVIAMVQDVTSRKQAEEELRTSHQQLRELTARIQQAREDERKSVAREVHDVMGQALTALKFDLAAVAARTASDLVTAQKLQSAGKLVDDTMQVVRRIATELRPGILDDLGLAAAIEWQAGEFQQRTGIQCALNTPGNRFPLSPERRTAMFRIFQETLTNVARHSGASRVFISLETEENNLRLEVRDNGIGITEEQMRRTKSLGLLGMQERATAAGGELDIRASREKGTSVVVRMPLEQKALTTERD